MTEIEKVRNGFVVTVSGNRFVYKTLDEVLEHLLLQYEGNGFVKIVRREDTE